MIINILMTLALMAIAAILLYQWASRKERQLMQRIDEERHKAEVRWAVAMRNIDMYVPLQYNNDAKVVSGMIVTSNMAVIEFDETFETSLISEFCGTLNAMGYTNPNQTNYYITTTTESRPKNNKFISLVLKVNKDKFDVQKYAKLIYLMDLK